MSSEPYRNPLEYADDRILAGRAADGDTAAFAALVRRHTPMMRAYARRILPGSADVDDVVQDAFIAAWDQLPKLEDAGRVRSWLLRIAGRKAIDRIRSTGPRADLNETELMAPERMAPHRQAEARAGIAALSDAINQLPDAQRECWVLRELGSYSYEEIGQDLDLPVSTVRGLLARARKDIIVRMEHWR
ncbi:RNA polymerase sigma factor [Leucobacter chromiireducens]|uniref:RNA polymerase sigma factor n=1 Tax=Leucobacter chromiireducens subsp. chromiireducens TaxID=660067 RepID=A0ABS1SNS1_9MICO|nr:sigma-70 family RNA polymerase sigma factor [Leucobacter chromiireducens]MBL3689832.1 sigma-70 family RNA polymerase sigma factor [Leucobacter chromiireducens subsp. chromiireducens]